MKSVNNIEVMLSKDLSVHKNGVTPIEALLLTAEHHRNAGGKVIDAEIADKNATDVKDPVLDSEGKQVKDEKGVLKTQERTEDQEIQRLRMRYSPAKVKAILNEVRTMPKTFKEAVERGVQVVLPSSPLSTTKLL